LRIKDIFIEKNVKWTFDLSFYARYHDCSWRTVHESQVLNAANKFLKKFWVYKEGFCTGMNTKIAKIFFLKFPEDLVPILKLNKIKEKFCLGYLARYKNSIDRPKNVSEKLEIAFGICYLVILKIKIKNIGYNRHQIWDTGYIGTF